LINKSFTENISKLNPDEGTKKEETLFCVFANPHILLTNTANVALDFNSVSEKLMLEVISNESLSYRF